jgi:hypothetical protein
MDPLARKVARRYAFKYQHKEKKQHKVDRLLKTIRDATGISKGVATDIADAIVRGREVERLAIQKGWPLQEGVLEGPNGTIELKELITPE